MKLLTLGQLRLDGAPVTRAKPLLLLAYLALEGPRHRRDLAELFFGGSCDAADALSTTLRRLRAAGDLVVERDGGLEAAVRCDAVDLRELARSGDAAGVAAGYAGPFSAGVAPPGGSELETWVLEQREELAARARDALLALAERALEDGDAREASRRAERALSLQWAPPLEPEALAHWHTVLARVEGPARARLRADAASLGLRLPAVPPRAPTNLPVPLTSFVGRDPERLELAGVLRRRDARLVVVHGPGGVGKTRLALQVGRDHLRDPAFADGVFFVPLDDLESPERMPGRVAESIGTPLTGASDAAGALAAAVGRRRILLILDNFEQLKGAAAILPRLLGACPNLSLLVTSRERLNLRAEWVLTLDGLAVPGPDASPEAARAAGAVRLFLERAQKARLGIELGPGDLAAVVRACELAGGYPLAVELAAAWAKTLGPAEIARRLEERALELESPHADARERHRSVRSIFEQSWRLLSSGERQVLGRLAVFRGGFDAGAAEVVAAGAAALLAGLVDKSLLRVSGGGRLGFHPLLQLYARAKLDEDPLVAADAHDRHAAHHRERLRALGAFVGGAAPPELLAYLRAEEGNVLSMLERDVAARRYGDAASLAERLALFYLQAEGPRAGLAVAGGLLAALPEDDPAAGGARAAFLAAVALLEVVTGDTQRAAVTARRALEAAEASDDPSQVVWASQALGRALTGSGRAAEAVAPLERAAELARARADAPRLSRSLQYLGLARTIAGDLEAAAEAHEEALALHRDGRLPSPMDAAWLLSEVAVSRLYAGRTDSAVAAAAEAARLAGPSGQASVARALMALVLVERGLQAGSPADLAQAEAIAAEVLPAARGAGETVTLAWAAGALGRVALERGDVGRAARLVGEGLEVLWSSRLRAVWPWLLPYLAEVAVATGDLALAGEVVGFLLHDPGVPAWVRGKARDLEARLGGGPVFAEAARAGAALPPDEVAARTRALADRAGPA